MENQPNIKTLTTREVVANIYKDFLFTDTGINRKVFLGFKDKEEFLNFIRGKTILDIGAGLGGFAKKAYEALGENSNTLIVSADIRLALGPTRTDIGQPHVRTSVGADWNHPPFKSESFDIIFSTGGFLFYENTYNDRIWEQLIGLLKKDTGEIRIELSQQRSDVDRAIEIAEEMGCKAQVITVERPHPYNKDLEPTTTTYLKVNR